MAIMKRALGQQAVGERFKMLEERMTTIKTLTPVSGGHNVTVTPPRRIQPVSLFSALISPSPPKAVSSGGTREQRSATVDDQSNITGERAHRVKATPLKGMRPIALQFGSPSPRKSRPCDAGVKTLAARSASFELAEDSPSRANRVTFSPRPSIQRMYAMDTPKKLLKTPTKLPDLSSPPGKSPMKSILKSPLHSPPHFNQYFVQQPSPLATSPGLSRAVHRISYTPRKEIGEQSRILIQTTRTPDTQKQNAKSSPAGKPSISTCQPKPDDSEHSADKVVFKDSQRAEDSSSAGSSQSNVPPSPAAVKSATPRHRRRRRRLSLRGRISPPFRGHLAMKNNTTNNATVLPGPEACSKSSPTLRSNRDQGDTTPETVTAETGECFHSQDSDVRTPQRKVGKKCTPRKKRVSTLPSGSGIKSSESSLIIRSKRPRSPEDSTSPGSVSRDACGTPVKKRKSTADCEMSRDSSSSSLVSAPQEFFAASQELPLISSVTDCAKFSRLGSNSSNFDSSHSGMLRGHQLSGSSDSNSNCSFEAPSPVFGAGGGIVRNKSLDRVLSSGCETSDAESSRPASPVFGKPCEVRLEPLQPSPKVVISPVKLNGQQNIMVSPANSARSKTSPGMKKYSPNVSAKSLAELIHSPLHIASNTPSVGKPAGTPRERNASSSPRLSLTEHSETKSRRQSRESPEHKDTAPRSRRSLYHTETKSFIKHA